MMNKYLWVYILIKFEEEAHPQISMYYNSNTAKITSFSECYVSCFSCLAQGSAVSLPYH